MLSHSHMQKLITVTSITSSPLAYTYIKASLTRGNNLLTSSEIHHWSRWKRTYQPGISWSGVGNNFTRNSLHDAPHAGILGGGEGA